MRYTQAIECHSTIDTQHKDLGNILKENKPIKLIVYEPKFRRCHTFKNQCKNTTSHAN